MSLFHLGDFTLHTGARSSWKIDCDALTDEDITTLTVMIRAFAGPYSSVEGVPRGGLRLAEALRPFVSLKGPHLIVDDVLTTGGSMERAKTVYRGEVPARQWAKVIGVVLFARGQCPHWVRPLFQLPEYFWAKPRHR
jgi:hypothetical protein